MAENLILTGFMGSGKTAVGKRLAKQLGRKFFDTDALIEKRMGKSIPEIFMAGGEPGFRQVEEEVITGLLAEAGLTTAGTVISLGGGAVTVPAIYERLLREPLVVFLDEDIDTAFQRARGDERPLASDQESFRKLYSNREERYREVAKFIIDARGRNVAQVADETVKQIHERTGIF